MLMDIMVLVQVEAVDIMIRMHHLMLMDMLMDMEVLLHLVLVIMDSSISSMDLLLLDIRIMQWNKLTLLPVLVLDQTV